MKRFNLAVILLIAACLFSGCSNKSKLKSVDDYVGFLYENMSLADSLTYPDEFWRVNVEKTLQVRDSMNWNIPEREFNYFVLPLRVNNETLDDFRTLYADTLCSIVKGMTLYDAVLEINHWCHEMVTYAPSDGRTSSPLATIRKGLGRCGEESVLTVSALRAAGIPARQVYTPRWAHTDDNHAWVEAFVDGNWYFLGACEPEPKLNMAWFNAPVSRAMLLHTKVFGKNYDGPEKVIERTEAYTEINVTPNYVPVREIVAKVVDENGRAVEGAEIDFTIYNYAEFYRVATYKSGNDGRASFITGLGDMLVFARKGDKFGVGVSKYDSAGTNDSRELTVALEHTIGDEFKLEYSIFPPVENPIQCEVSSEEIEINKVRFERENQIREAREKGNAKVLESFREILTNNELEARGNALFKSLTQKDFNDVTLDVLTDALEHSLYYGDEFVLYRDSPRIEREFLLPYFTELNQNLPNFKSVDEILTWIKDNIEIIDNRNPQQLRIPPVKVFRAKMSDRFSQNLFFVAVCRAKGFEARIDPTTSKTQFKEGGLWHDVDLSGSETSTYVANKGFLKLSYSGAEISEPYYYTHFTISNVTSSGNSLLTLDEEGNLRFGEIFASPMELQVGYYLLTGGIRDQDGNSNVVLQFFNIDENEKTSIELELNGFSRVSSVISKIESDKIALSDSGSKKLLSDVADENYILIFTGDKDEPTTHAVRQLNSIADNLTKWDVRCVVIGKAIPNLANIIHIDSFVAEPFETLLNQLNISSKQLPLVLYIGKKNEVLYLSQGYNTSLAEELKQIIE